MAQNIPSPFTESTPVIEEISIPFTESIPMDQDFESPLVEEEVIPSEGDQVSRSSFETPVLDISKTKAICLILNWLMLSCFKTKSLICMTTLLKEI
uniref:Uncharacterized protein n=1 Tax=Lactuca sativa TaxID=4236 RepID=A0A9R1VPJ1_LACSA|nr:hypothetical protein LSAT_V11C400205600 [Lactuca sativa]